MSDFAEVMVIVEGKTEQTFVESLLGPYLGMKNQTKTLTTCWRN